MLRVAVFLLASAAAVFGRESPRIDASTPESLQRTYGAALAALGDDDQQKFALAMTTIGLVFSQRPDLGGSKRAMETINGKTAAEIIAEARRLTGYVRRGVKTVDGSGAAKFSESVGNILLSLPESKQADFSEAVAKILYRRESEKIADAEFFKSVDGKTADELIEFAATIDVPFLSGNRRAQKNYSLEKLNRQEAEKMGIRGGKGGEAKKEYLDFSESLVPPSK